VTIMQRRQDTNGSGCWRALLSVSVLSLVAGCGWFDSSTPVGTPPRPGADRQVAPSAALPAPSGGRAYEQGTVAVDETRGGAAIGSIIAGKGGQKAQKEAIEKEQMERDRKDREARLERDAEDKERKAREKEAEKGTGGSAPPSAAPAGVAPPSAAPSIEAAPGTVPPPPPVSTPPIPAPAQPATDTAPQAPATPAAPVPEKQSALPTDTLVVADRRIEIFASI
jgi:hypothetical protein